MATPAVMTHFSENKIEFEQYLIRRHLQSDWGDVPPGDAIANDFAVENGLRILSAYVAANRRFWVITEADRSVTTFLFPEEY
ncbi:plasmid related protein [Undibacterium parvum]|uniref:plasmid related protein n=1 Tax=Undibacterium parvum TaxID=401471 RepID=UPI001D130A2C|nr:plasmid related protein [Undibacterium parvum]